MLTRADRGHRRSAIYKLAAVVTAAISVATAPVALAAPESAKPFQPLLGWWIGKGYLGFKNGQSEIVTCRATYRSGDNDYGLRQAVRCASASGNVELTSAIENAGTQLSGTWAERRYNLSGTVSGNITPSGFKVQVRGDTVAANMDVLVKGSRHIVEIQFHDSTLVGLTMVFERGQATN